MNFCHVIVCNINKIKFIFGNFFVVINFCSTNITRVIIKNFCDQPVVGMRIMWGLEGEGSVWKEGYIMDPKSGKTYRCKLRVEDDNVTMHVRGYSGVSLLGRTQTWYRVE